MNKAKRLIVATLAGIGCGFICYAFASSGDYEIGWPLALQIITSRSLIGFAIGISCIKMGHWSVHGLIMGLLFSLPIAFSGLMAPESPEYSKFGMFAGTVLLGMIYGLLIEIITSMLFRAKMQTAR